MKQNMSMSVHLFPFFLSCCDSPSLVMLIVAIPSKYSILKFKWFGSTVLKSRGITLKSLTYLVSNSRRPIECIGQSDSIPKHTILSKVYRKIYQSES